MVLPKANTGCLLHKGVQVAAELDLPPEADFAAMASLQRLLVLEGVQDPGNMVRQRLTARRSAGSGEVDMPTHGKQMRSHLRVAGHAAEDSRGAGVAGRIPVAGVLRCVQ
jgi:hypothetical protein